jgi:hypothetical protein
MSGGIISVSAAMTSPQLFNPYFQGSSWDVWRTVLKGACRAATEPEHAAFAAVAARQPPQKPVRELICIAGRGAGKDSVASLIATCAAINFEPRGKLRPGETAIVMCLACDRQQASILFKYIRGYFEEIPALKAMVTAVTNDSIDLCNSVSIEVHSNSFRAVRGRSILCAVLDECAFFRDENFASPDVEVDAALSPGLARVSGSMKILISSVHKRSGLLYNRYRDFYGVDNSDILVVFGGTRQFNPTFSESIIEKSLLEDPERYSAEYLCRWRDDLSTWLSRELLEAAVDRGVYVRPPDPGINYFAGADASGGRNDSFTAAISHREGDEKIVLDALYERRAPFNPTEVVDEIIALMRQYDCTKITGDKYAAGWVTEAFAKRGGQYVQSELDRSAIYMNALPIFTSGRARLLDNPKLVSQFAALERRTFSTGRERIDPGPGHDDLCNSVAIALSLADNKRGPVIIPPELIEWAETPDIGINYYKGY